MSLFFYHTTTFYRMEKFYKLTGCVLLTFLTLRSLMFQFTTTKRFLPSATISTPDSSSTWMLPTLEELVESITDSSHPEHTYPCPPDTLPFPDTPLPPLHRGNPFKKIPQIVHVTGKSRCVPPYMFKHLQQWHLEGHGLFFHDDRAVQRILQYAVLDNNVNNGAGLVPNLEATLSCVSSGATLADIWRYVFMVSRSYIVGSISLDGSRDPFRSAYF